MYINLAFIARMGDVHIVDHPEIMPEERTRLMINIVNKDTPQGA